VSADFWLNLQVRWDLYRAQLSESKELEMIVKRGRIHLTDKRMG